MESPKRLRPVLVYHIRMVDYQGTFLCEMKKPNVLKALKTFFLKEVNFGTFLVIGRGRIFAQRKEASLSLRTPAGEKKSRLCVRSLLPDGVNHRVNECSLLLAGAVQISQMAADGVGVCGGCARHQFALSFGGRGLMHDDADFLPSLDSATPPDCSMIWRAACPA